MIKCAPCKFPVSASTAPNHYLPRLFRTIFVCMAFYFVAALFASLAVAGQHGPSAAGGQAATPAPGSVERKAIADALRQEVKALHGVEQVARSRAMQSRHGKHLVRARTWTIRRGLPRPRGRHGPNGQDRGLRNQPGAGPGRLPQRRSALGQAVSGPRPSALQEWAK